MTKDYPLETAAEFNEYINDQDLDGLSDMIRPYVHRPRRR